MSLIQPMLLALCRQLDFSCCFFPCFNPCWSKIALPFQPQITKRISLFTSISHYGLNDNGVMWRKNIPTWVVFSDLPVFISLRKRIACCPHKFNKALLSTVSINSKRISMRIGIVFDLSGISISNDIIVIAVPVVSCSIEMWYSKKKRLKVCDHFPVENFCENFPILFILRCRNNPFVFHGGTCHQNCAGHWKRGNASLLLSLIWCLFGFAWDRRKVYCLELMQFADDYRTSNEQWRCWALNLQMKMFPVMTRHRSG